MLEILQAVRPEPWWEHSAETFLAGTVPVILWMLENRRRARNEANIQAGKIQHALDEKHKENTVRLDAQDEKLDELLNERKYVPAHGHREASGPLCAENIFPKR